MSPFNRVPLARAMSTGTQADLQAVLLFQVVPVAVGCGFRWPSGRRFALREQGNALRSRFR